MIRLDQAVDLVTDYGCEDLGTFVEAVNAEHGTRYDDEDLDELWRQAKQSIAVSDDDDDADLDLLDDTQ